MDRTGLRDGVLDQTGLRNGVLGEMEPRSGVLSGALDGDGRKKEIPDSRVHRMVPLGVIEEVLVREHSFLSQELEETMNEVPVGPLDGEEYGKRIQELTWTRNQLEVGLEEVHQIRGNQRSRLCSLKGVESEVTVGELEEVLQTTTVALEEVRRNVDQWKDAMWSEYRSLTIETGAIEPIDVSLLNDEEVEYVPGKLVCTVKAGPNGGRKKCRGVICGNMLDEAVDPSPNTNYASGADGLLIRTTLKHGVQQQIGAYPRRISRRLSFWHHAQNPKMLGR